MFLSLSGCARRGFSLCVMSSPDSATPQAIGQTLKVVAAPPTARRSAIAPTLLGKKILNVIGDLRLVDDLERPNLVVT